MCRFLHPKHSFYLLEDVDCLSVVVCGNLSRNHRVPVHELVSMETVSRLFIKRIPSFMTAEATSGS